MSPTSCSGSRSAPRCTSRSGPGPTSTRPSSTPPWPSSTDVLGRGRRRPVPGVPDRGRHQKARWEPVTDVGRPRRARCSTWRRSSTRAAACRRRGPARPAPHGRAGRRSAIESGRHLVVQAGHGYRQDARLPRAGDRVGPPRRRRHRHQGAAGPARRQGPARSSSRSLPDFDWAVLKGRSNYVCLQRVREVSHARRRRQEQLELDDVAPRVRRRDRPPRVPGSPPPPPAISPMRRSPCPTRAAGPSPSAATSAPVASAARWASRASPSTPAGGPRTADVVVVNTHLYGLDVAAGGAILPEHDVVVFDEAHGLEDIMSDTVGTPDRPGPVRRRRGGDPAHPRRPDDRRRRRRRRRLAGARPSDRTPADACTSPTPTTCRPRCSPPAPGSTPRSTPINGIQPTGDEAKQKRLRAQLMIGRTIEAIDVALGHRPSPPRPERDQFVDFVSGSPEHARLELAPLDVGPALAAGRVVAAHGRAHQRDDPRVAGPAGRTARPGSYDAGRRRQPVRLPPPRVALLPGLDARPPRRALPGRRCTTS